MVVIKHPIALRGRLREIRLHHGVIRRSLRLEVRHGDHLLEQIRCASLIANPTARTDNRTVRNRGRPQPLLRHPAEQLQHVLRLSRTREFRDEGVVEEGIRPDSKPLRFLEKLHSDAGIVRRILDA